MVAVVISTVITQQIKGHSFFTWQLDRRGINIQGGRESGLMATTRVADVMSLRYTPIPLGLNINGVRENCSSLMTKDRFSARLLWQISQMAPSIILSTTSSMPAMSRVFILRFCRPMIALNGRWK